MEAWRADIIPAASFEKEACKLGAKEVDTELSDRTHQFIEMKRQYILICKILDLLDGQEVKNELIYNQIFLTLDGLILRLVNFKIEIIKLKDKIKSSHSNLLTRNRRTKIKSQNRKITYTGPGWTEESKKRVLRNSIAEDIADWEDAYDIIFPDVVKRGDAKPNDMEIDELIEDYCKAMGPIEGHRDTCVAHWDKKKVPATWLEIGKVFEECESMLRKLHLIISRTTYVFDFVGIAADIEETAANIAFLLMNRSVNFGAR